MVPSRLWVKRNKNELGTRMAGLARLHKFTLWQILLALQSEKAPQKI
jgi:hypothetical protein